MADAATRAFAPLHRPADVTGQCAGKSSEAGRGQLVALREYLEHERRVCDPYAGEVILPILEVRHDRTNAFRVALSVTVGERRERVGRTTEGRRPRAHPSRRPPREAIIALQQRRDPQRVPGRRRVALARELAADVGCLRLSATGDHGRLEHPHQPTEATRRRHLPRSSVRRRRLPQQVPGTDLVAGEELAIAIALQADRLALEAQVFGLVHLRVDCTAHERGVGGQARAHVPRSSSENDRTHATTREWTARRCSSMQPEPPGRGLTRAWAPSKHEAGVLQARSSELRPDEQMASAPPHQSLSLRPAVRVREEGRDRR
jgi:hypothetical protein